MATLKNRLIQFEDEGITRTGIIQECSHLGTLLVNVIDKLDDLKQIIIPSSQKVSFIRKVN